MKLGLQPTHEKLLPLVHYVMFARYMSLFICCLLKVFQFENNFLKKGVILRRVSRMRIDAKPPLTEYHGENISCMHKPARVQAYSYHKQ